MPKCLLKDQLKVKRGDATKYPLHSSACEARVEDLAKHMVALHAERGADAGIHVRNFGALAA